MPIILSRDDVHQRIAEYAGTRPAPSDDALDQVEAALFIEEVFGIILSDHDMTSERLGTFEAMEQLVIDRLGAS